MLDYKKIPEGADYAVVKKYLIDFLQNKEKIVKDKGIMYALEQLELIAEQHSYYELDMNLSNDLSKFLISILDFSNAEIIDSILFTVINMSLNEVFEVVKQNKKNASLEVFKIISEVETELLSEN